MRPYNDTWPLFAIVIDKLEFTSPGLGPVVHWIIVEFAK